MSMSNILNVDGSIEEVKEDEWAEDSVRGYVPEKLEGVEISQSFVLDNPDEEDDNDFSISFKKENTTEESAKEKPKAISVEEAMEQAKKEDSSAEEESLVLSQIEQLRLLSDQIISAIVGEKSCKEYALNKLLSSASPSIFKDENYIIFKIFHQYKDRIRNINVDADFVSLYLDNNKDIIEKSKSHISNISAYGDIDGSETLAYIAGVVKQFNRLVGMKNQTLDDFNLNFEKYIVLFKTVESQKIYTDSIQILQDGLSMGNKRLIGPDDSYNYSRRSLANLEGLLDMNAGEGFVSMRDVILEPDGEKKKSVKIADFDTLDALNDIYGGVYTGTFYEVLAPTKGGKSKFCARMNHTAMIKYGTNVTVWAEEGGYKDWTAQLRAIHFDYTYNTGADVKDKKYGVTQEVIAKDRYPSEELKELEKVSALDLASNPSYGNVDFVDRPFNVETFLDDIDASVKKNNSKLLIIDYVQLIRSQGNKSERERVSDAYKALLAYVKTNNIALITPAQYKQDTIDSLSEGNSIDLRTSGGVSAEVFRTPDIIFTLWASTEDLENNKMTIKSVPCRFNKPFPDIPCYIDLGVCKFMSLKD